jgi:N-methylhydantoinase A/oxoprolinase/acetone carboxylase beta subunit
MVQALRRVSVEQGVDPAGLALVAFGGAGPLHACDLANELGARVVIVPAAAGVLSAVGLLSAPPQVELVRSWPTPTERSGLEEAAALLGEAALTELDRGPNEAVVTTLFDCRYAGQSHEIRVDHPDSFHAEHERINGYSRPADTVEVIAIRAVAAAPAPATVEELSAPWERQWEGDVPVGPQVVSRDDCTIWVPSGWVGKAGPHGSLILERT